MSSKVVKVARIKVVFLWNLGWLHLDELKGAFGESIEPMCQLADEFLLDMEDIQGSTYALINMK